MLIQSLEGSLQDNNDLKIYREQILSIQQEELRRRDRVRREGHEDSIEMQQQEERRRLQFEQEHARLLAEYRDLRSRCHQPSRPSRSQSTVTMILIHPSIRKQCCISQKSRVSEESSELASPSNATARM